MMQNLDVVDVFLLAGTIVYFGLLVLRRIWDVRPGQEPPKSRVVIQQWDSVEKIQAYRDSAAFKDLLPMRNKLAKVRSFAVEGVSN
jgi:uncharacterized protein (DUF1330 family)